MKRMTLGHDEINDSGQGFKCYEWLCVTNEVNNFGSRAQVFKYYGWLLVTNEMNNSRCYECFKPWMRWVTLGQELGALSTKNDFTYKNGQVQGM